MLIEKDSVPQKGYVWFELANYWQEWNITEICRKANWITKDLLKRMHPKQHRALHRWVLKGGDRAKLTVTSPPPGFGDR